MAGLQVSGEANYEAECFVIRDFVQNELMSDPRGRFVWDLGCGAGAFAFAMRKLGARRVLGSDLAIPQGTNDEHPVRFVSGGVGDAELALGSLKDVDTVFMHLMSEHVMDFPTLMMDLHDRLNAGAEILIHHDNYFSPTGSHDHGLVALNPASWAACQQGPSCWETAEKCKASETRRALLREHWPGLWTAQSESTADPTDCTRCNYFRRSQPWAHVIYGDSLPQTFPESFFRTSLNRLTPSQVIWDALDAGFTMTKQKRTWLNNVPSDALSLEFGRHCLQTFTLTMRLVKP